MPSARPSSEPATPIRTRVREAVDRAWQAAVAGGSLPAVPDPAASPAVEIERPANPEHGDFATNLALKLARPLRQNPLRIAEGLAAALQDGSRDGSLVASAEAAAPGFVNIRLADAVFTDAVDGILRDPASWGRVPPVNPRTVNVEFVSANPTGPLTIGNARGAFVGDLLCRVLEAGGQTVTREYYFNDSGAQIDRLGASVHARRTGADVPTDGYHGDYVAELADAVPAEIWAAATAPGADAASMLGRWAADTLRVGIQASLERLGVLFDVWTSEGSLHDGGWVSQAIERMRAHGDTYELDGALWFQSTKYGDDKDRVVIRSNGEPTYLAADVGYLAEKFSRGFDHIIYVWGIDHHGYVARTKAAAESIGIERARVQMLLTGWVSVVRGKEVVAMSKRKGDIYRLDTLLDDFGTDAARWFFASRGANLDIELDIELAKRQSAENPVYYVQYAHARMASILRKAADGGLVPAASVGALGSGSPDADLARAVARLPEVVEDAVRAEETHGITHYATELATQVQAFYRDARVIDPEQPERSARRLALVQATQTTLAKALALLGISAPESM